MFKTHFPATDCDLLVNCSSFGIFCPAKFNQFKNDIFGTKPTKTKIYLKKEKKMIIMKSYNE